MRRGILLLGLIIVSSIVAAAPARAAEPSVQRIHSEGSNLPVQDCGTFTVLLSFVHDEVITTFTDEAGTPVRAQIRFHFTGTLVNSVTGKTAYELGDYTVFTDFQNGRTVGLVLLIRVPGERVALLEIGSLSFDASGHASLSGAPRVFQGEALVCEILS
jgi:hypothetical protein